MLRHRAAPCVDENALSGLKLAGFND